MRHTYIIVLFAFMFLSSCGSSRRVDKPIEEENLSPKNEKPYTTEAYIAKFKSVAVWQMHKFGVPASITLAQAILESNSGNSELARFAKNHFGIKCTGTWNGKTYLKDDDHKNECFRMYSNEVESFKDHIEFLKRDRYAKLFALDSKDYKGWAKGLKKTGYATNPKYPDLLISLIERYNLHELDKKKGSKRASHNDIYN